jgi:ribonuclease Z
MSFALRFLGTAAARPTIERNVSSIAVIREGETLLIDCGEGTQRQMLRYGISFALNDVFFTHFDTDHVLGTVGLLRTFQLQGRTEPLRIWGPPGATRMIHRADAFGADKLGFPLEVTEVTPDTPIARNGYTIVPFAGAHHHTPVYGYAFIENIRLGRFNPDQARSLGIPEGPMWGALHRGQSVTLPDGRVIHADSLVSEPRPGRRIAITGDTRPCESTAIAAKGADLLVHESTFADEEAARAVETGHSTAREAAEVAALAGVRRLILTHLSARYSRDTADLEREARSVFPQTTIARDGLEVTVPFPDESLADATDEPPRPALQADAGAAPRPPRAVASPQDPQG